MNRIILIFALLLTASLALSACSSDDGEKVIKIGAAVSETGRYAKEGKNTRQGYLIWEEWVNDKYGGVDIGGERYRVDLVMYDDQSDPDTTAALVERLIDEDKVDFLLGPYSSTLNQRAIEVADPRGMIVVQGTGSSETLFRQSFQNLFAVHTPAGNYTQSALQALAEKGAKSVVIAHTDVIFPASVAEGAVHWAEEYGLEVLAVEKYPQDVDDVASVLSKFKDLNPDVFLGAGYYNDALLFVRTAKELDFNPKAMVLTVGPSDSNFIDEVGQDADYLIGPTQWEPSMSYEGAYFGSASDYAERYEAEFGSLPPYQSASATAAALALHLSVEAAGSLDSDAVRDALRNLNADTFFGRIIFDATGKNSSRPMGAIQIQNGSTRVVAPSDYSVAELIYPAPSWEDR